MVGKPVPRKPAPEPVSAKPIPGVPQGESPLSRHENPSMSRETKPAPKAKSGARLVSLDAYRGFIMTMLAANGFGLLAFSRIRSDSPVWQVHNRDFWSRLAFHFDHPAWVSLFDGYKVSFWDLIQPAFMFMVGVSMPFSYARRELQGQSSIRRALHALSRSIVLVLLGVFLYSRGHDYTNWIFPNVLCQIGLGYFIAWLFLNRGLLIQLGGIALILIGYWGWFWMSPPPAEFDYSAVNASKENGEVFEGRFAPWSKNSNAAYEFDQWLLPKLRSAPPAPHTAPELKPAAASFKSVKSNWQPAFLNIQAPVENSTSATSQETTQSDATVQQNVTTQPGELATESIETPAAAETKLPAEPPKPSWIRQWFFSNPEPYTFDRGGYLTLNFVPSIATTLLGMLCGQLLMTTVFGRWEKLGLLVLAAGVCLGLGIAAHLTICPVVKRIWTPSWVLFSGGYVIGLLAIFYLLFDIAPLRILAFPLVVVGMNSILIYMMGQTLGGWTRDAIVKVHLSGFLTHVFGPKAMDPDWYGPITMPTVAFLLFWLFLYWLYKQRIFLRI
jgi:predicted acyltransferase